MTRHILSALDAVLPRKQSWRLRVLQQWPTIIGKLADKVKLHKVADSFVVLSVTHPGLAHELLMLTDLIRTKINTVIGHEAIKAVHFRTQNVAKKKAPAPLARARQPRAPLPLNAVEQKQLGAISNEELRTALARFYSTCKQRTNS